MMTGNQFRKELNDKNVDPRVAYFLTILFEQNAEIARQLTDCAKMQVQLANAVQQFVGLNEAMNKKIVAIATGKYTTDGISVQSVAYSPEEIAQSREQKTKKN